MNVETQRKNIVHRILDIENEQLLSQIEELLDKDVYTFTTSGKPLSTSAYKNHLTEIIKVSEDGDIGYTTDEARKKISRK
jgi:hypothetical protein